MTKPKPSSRPVPHSRRVAALLLALSALAPVLAVAWRASADYEQADAPEDARRRVLSKVATDASVLINVTQADMPSSPDILNLGKRTTRALERCLADNAEAQIRAECARMLHALGERSSLPTLRAALADWEAPVRLEVVHALAAMPEEASFEPLAALYRRPDEEDWNKIAVLRALGALGSHRAVRLLRTELRSKKSVNHAAVFNALWRSRHLMARATLVGDVALALGSDEESLILAGVGAAAELRSPALVQKLVPLMEHPHADIRNKAVYAVGRIGDRTATQALVKHVPKVRDARMLNNIAFALERLDRKAFYREIAELVRHKQAIIRLNAAFVVGDVKRPEGLPVLEKALDDPSDYVRTSAIVAVGKLGTSDGIAKLERFVNDANPSIRQEAIYAIHDLSGKKRIDLIFDKLYASELAKSRQGGGMRLRAAIELGRAGDARVREFLLRCFESHHCALRDVESFVRADKDANTPGRLLLSWVRGRDELGTLIGDLRPAGARDLAQSAFTSAFAAGNGWEARRSASVLGDLGDPSAAPVVAAHLSERDSWLRAVIAVAAARLGEAAADRVLLGDLDIAPAEWLPRLSRAFEAIEEAPARGRLAPELGRRAQSGDLDVRMAAAAIMLSWDPENAVFRLLDSLAGKSVREVELAARYLERARDEKVTWVLRRALSRETRPYVADRLRMILDERG